MGALIVETRVCVWSTLQTIVRLNKIKWQGSISATKKLSLERRLDFLLAVRLRLIIWHTPTSALILRYATDVRTIYGWLFSCQHEKQRWHPTCNALPEVLVCGGSDGSNLQFGCSDVRHHKRTELQLHLRRTWSPVVRREDMPKSNAFVMGSGHLGLDWRGCLREDRDFSGKQHRRFRSQTLLPVPLKEKVFNEALSSGNRGGRLSCTSCRCCKELIPRANWRSFAGFS